MIYEVGMKLKRKFYNYGEVTIEKIGQEYVTISDGGTRHVVSKKKLESYFDVMLEDTVVKKVYKHQNEDRADKHNIAGAMNRPDRAAETLAQLKKEED